MSFYPNAYMLEEIGMVILPVLTSAVPSSLLAVASYVLTSMALYIMASRRGIGKAWLSWVPVLNVWIIGSLSDQYRYVVKGQIRSRRKVLLVLNLLKLILGAAVIGTCIFTVADLISGSIYGAVEKVFIRNLMGPLLTVGSFALPLAGISIAAAVIRYMALYDIYTSVDPSNSVLFLVISIIFHVTEPFFLFFSRNRDGGMPPRREEPRWQSQEPDYGTREETGDYL